MKKIISLGMLALIAVSSLVFSSCSSTKKAPETTTADSAPTTQSAPVAAPEARTSPVDLGASSAGNAN